MKHLLFTTIAAVLLVGCGEAQPPEPTTAKVPDINIHKAAQAGNIEAVKQHIAAGTDVNAKNSGGWTPLHSVATKEIVELLIAEGADVNTKNELGETPLDWVLWCMQPKIAALLRKHGGKTGEELKAEGK